MDLLRRAEKTEVRLQEYARRLKLDLNDRTHNDVINTLDLIHPDWRGYEVPQTTGKNWRLAKGEELEMVGGAVKCLHN